MPPFDWQYPFTPRHWAWHPDYGELISLGFRRRLDRMFARWDRANARLLKRPTYRSKRR